ncbi:HAD family phosphatase, partial [bacterium]|nr:HAD family phosphatase [bacterium]
MLSLKDWTPKTDANFKLRDTLAFDLDDTLTYDGELSSEVLSCLEKCGDRGLLRILVTGRSAGWADAIIKLLPFDAVVAENGAVLRYFPNGRSAKRAQEKAFEEFWTPEGFASQPPANIRDQHANAMEKILKAVPGVQVASDQPYRLYDLAIDFCEEIYPPLGLKEAEQIKKCFEEEGAVAKISSIHVNGWWGEFSKLDGLTRVLESVYRKSIERNLIYVGDSPNDGPLFASKALSVGVANVNDFSSLDFDRPRFICSGRSSDGSIELMEMV